MKHLRHILIGILLLLTSCIENSIPYPVVTLQILGVEREGFNLRRKHTFRKGPI